jgi:hypothetical protein
MLIATTKWMPILLGGMILFNSGCSVFNQFRHGRWVRVMSKYMVGDYSNEKQHLKNTKETFHNVNVYIRPVWNKEYKTRWLYVEQTYIKDSVEHVYRQRIYKLSVADEGVKCEIFRFDPIIPYDLSHNDLSSINSILPSQLEYADGCNLYFTREKYTGAFTSSRKDESCKNAYNEASYVKSRVKIFPDKIESADQGWVGSKRVWGNRAPYVLQKDQAK